MLFPGGMRPQVQLGGFPKRGAITVSRPWSTTWVQNKLFKLLDAKTGLAKAEVSYTALDAEKKPVGDPITYTGVLTGVKRPAYKAGTSEEAHLQITIAPEGEIS